MGRWSKSASLSFSWLVVTVFVAPSLRAQTESPSNPPSPRSASQASTIPQAKKLIRVQSNEVVVPVTVTDKSGEIVLDLSQKDFRILDSGVEQSIDHWDLGGDPLAVVLLIESSAHVGMMAPAIHSIASIFTQTVMALDGEAAVLTYDSTVEIRQPFTQDHDAVETAISNVEFQAQEKKLYDGMAKSVELLSAQPTTYRRILLVVGESQDYASEAKLGPILRNAQLANIAIYSIGASGTTADLRYGEKRLPPIKMPKPVPPVSIEGNVLTPVVWLLMRGSDAISNHQLEIAAAATGGIHYSALRDRTIRTALDDIGGELHAQYILSYMPNTERVPGFNTITVNVSRPGLNVRTRPGYFVVPAEN